MLIEKFLSHVEVREDGCHMWTASLTPSGYGNFRLNGKATSAHRAAWFLAGNELPVKPEILDHLCRNRWCVNVQHLEVVTYSENSKRGELSLAKRPDPAKCAKGLHLWVEENLTLTSRGFTCRACKNAAQRKAHARR